MPNIMCDQTGAPTVFHSSKDYPATLRRVVIKHDAGKKVPDIKRHIAVDTQGLPHAIWVTTADVMESVKIFKRNARASLR